MTDQNSIKASVDAQRGALAPRLCVQLLSAVQGTLTPCAVILGPTGAGKTSAVKWMLAGLRPAVLSAVRNPEFAGPGWMKSGPVEFMRARDLASANRRHGLGEGFAPEVQRARNASVLAVDDVGSEGADVTALQDVLDWRYELGLPTIVTAGFTREQMTEHLGAAYVRRIVDQHVLRKDGSEYPVLIAEAW